MTKHYQDIGVENIELYYSILMKHKSRCYTTERIWTEQDDPIGLKYCFIPAKPYFGPFHGIYMLGSNCLYSGFLQMKKNKQSLHKLPQQSYVLEFVSKIQSKTASLYFHLQKEKRHFYISGQVLIKDLQQNNIAD